MLAAYPEWSHLLLACNFPENEIDITKISAANLVAPLDLKSSINQPVSGDMQLDF